MPTVQFLYFDGCPLATSARDELEHALAAAGIAGYDAVDLQDERTPEALRGWGSPTILVDGIDVTGASPGAAIGCRIYPGSLRVPSRARILEVLRDHKR